MSQIDRLAHHHLGRSGPRKKTGCFTCRRRKVRCDEAKPVCTHCVRLRLRCQYNATRATATATPEDESLRAGTNLDNESPSPSRSAIPVRSGSCSGNLDQPPRTNLPQSNESRPVCSAFDRSPRHTDDHQGRIHRPKRSVNVDQLFAVRPAVTEQRDRVPALGKGHSFRDTESLGSSISSTASQNSIGGSDRANDTLALVFGSGTADASFPVYTASNSSMFHDSSNLAREASPAATLEQQHQEGESPSYTNATTYQEHLLQCFLYSRSPAAIFVPLDVEWDFMKEAVASVARNFSPLMNALCCYSGVRQSRQEGRSSQWTVHYYKSATADLRVYLADDVGNDQLKKVFAAVFFIMMAELLSESELNEPDASLLRSAYQLLRRYRHKTKSWSGLGRLFVSWIALLDVKALIAGRDGDLLVGPISGSVYEKSQDSQDRTEEERRHHGETDEGDTLDERLNKSPSFLVYNSFLSPVLDFYIETQAVNRRIVEIDLHHRARGTLSDEYEVLQIAHRISADLESLWHARPSAIELYDHPSEKLYEILAPKIATHVCHIFRAYVANFLAQFIYLHRVAFSIYPRTERVSGAVNKIVELAAMEVNPSHTGERRECAPGSFLWPLFIAGLEASTSQQKWIEDEMQRMAEANIDQRHPNIEKSLLLFRELGQRQNVLKAAADSRCVRRELFADFFVMI